MRSTSDARWCITVGPLNVSLPPLWYEKRDWGFWMQGERRRDKEGLSGGTVKWVREKGVWLPGRGAAREREVWGESFFDGFDLRSKRRDEIEIGVLEVQFWAREIGLGDRCQKRWVSAPRRTKDRRRAEERASVFEIEREVRDWIGSREKGKSDETTKRLNRWASDRRKINVWTREEVKLLKWLSTNSSPFIL
jgi:hypothetical protein